MKGIRVFGLFVLAFMLIMLLAWLGNKREYDWTPTFAPDSSEPFGCLLFDSVVGHSLGGRYQYDGAEPTLRQLVKTPARPNQGWLFIDYSFRFTPNETHDLLQLARRGDCVMVVAASAGKALSDSLDILFYGQPWDAGDLERAMSLYKEHTIVVCEQRDGYPLDSFPLHAMLHEKSMSVLKSDTVYGDLRDSLRAEWLAHVGYGDGGAPLALRFAIGRGELILVSTPLVFTNYGVLGSRSTQYLLRLLSLFGERSITRVKLKTHARMRNEDAFALLNYISQQPPLWWAWCISILLILLFMLTNARRRQRAIPVVAPPQNHSLGFVRMIGTLYARQDGHADLVAKKFHYTAERLRRELHIDITQPQEDIYSAAVIAQNSTLSAEEAAQIIVNVRRQLGMNVGLTAQQMRFYVDCLDSLLPPTRR